MSTFDHPNVLTLVGVCLDGGPAPYIVMPFMFNGCLLSCLKKKREELVLPPQAESQTNTVSCGKAYGMKITIRFCTKVCSFCQTD